MWLTGTVESFDEYIYMYLLNSLYRLVRIQNKLRGGGGNYREGKGGGRFFGKYLSRFVYQRLDNVKMHKCLRVLSILLAAHDRPD